MHHAPHERPEADWRKALGTAERRSGYAMVGRLSAARCTAMSWSIDRVFRALSLCTYAHVPLHSAPINRCR